MAKAAKKLDLRYREKMAHAQFMRYAGFTHYYVNMAFDAVGIYEHLRYKLTRRDASDLNRDDRRKGGTRYTHRAGEEGERFAGRDRAEEEACKYFLNKLVPVGALVLMDGGHASLEAERILAAAPDCNLDIQAANGLYEQIETIWREHETGAFYKELPAKWRAEAGKIQRQWVTMVASALVEASA